MLPEHYAALTHSEHAACWTIGAMQPAAVAAGAAAAGAAAEVVARRADAYRLTCAAAGAVWGSAKGRYHTGSNHRARHTYHFLAFGLPLPGAAAPTPLGAHWGSITPGVRTSMSSISLTAIREESESLKAGKAVGGSVKREGQSTYKARSRY